MAVHRMHVGDVEIVSVPDGYADLNGWPAAQDDPNPVEWAPYAARNPQGFHGPDHRWRIHNGCYLVRSEGRTTLVDAGVGVGPYPRYANMRGHLLDSFAEAGVRLEDIDEVFLSHAHPDHVGWNVDESTGRPRFPNARYRLHRRDWEHFGGREPPPPYFRRFLLPLERAGVLDLIEGETMLTRHLTAFETPGHTPGHMSLLVTSDGERAIIAGDVLDTPMHITEPERAFGSDWDREMGIRTRIALVDRLEAEGIRVAVQHFPEPGWGDIVRLDGRRWFRAS